MSPTVCVYKREIKNDYMLIWVKQKWEGQYTGAFQGTRHVFWAGMLHGWINVSDYVFLEVFYHLFFCTSLLREHIHINRVLHWLSLQFKMKDESVRKLCINPFIRTRLKYHHSALRASIQPLPGGIGTYSVLFLLPLLHTGTFCNSNTSRPKKR